MLILPYIKQEQQTEQDGLMFSILDVLRRPLQSLQCADLAQHLVLAVPSVPCSLLENGKGQGNNL